MEINVTENPNKWVILKLPDNQYKVFGTWSGGYLNGDSWKLNSGIKLVSIETNEDFIYFHGYSGSCYKCHMSSYGVAHSYGLSVLDNILEKSEGKIEVIKSIEDWWKELLM